MPYHVTWAHEVVLEHDGEFAELTSIRELVDLARRLKPTVRCQRGRQRRRSRTSVTR